jgi:hypothetical protein
MRRRVGAQSVTGSSQDWNADVERRTDHRFRIDRIRRSLRTSWPQACECFGEDASVSTQQSRGDRGFRVRLEATVVVGRDGATVPVDKSRSSAPSAVALPLSPGAASAARRRPLLVFVQGSSIAASRCCRAAARASVTVRALARDEDRRGLRCSCVGSQARDPQHCDRQRRGPCQAGARRPV